MRVDRAVGTGLHDIHPLEFRICSHGSTKAWLARREGPACSEHKQALVHLDDELLNEQRGAAGGPSLLDKPAFVKGLNMNTIDIILIVLLTAIVLLAIRSILSRRKKGGGCGCGCSGCSLQEECGIKDQTD